jgi:hypothetical protein
MIRIGIPGNRHLRFGEIAWYTQKTIRRMTETIRAARALGLVLGNWNSRISLI